MNTIHTIDDLMQVLDENPQWAEAMRARLLTRELIELPERFTQFVAEVNKFVEATNQRFDGLEQRLDQSVEATNQRFDGLEQRLEQSIETTNQHFDTLETRVKSIQDDVGILKGAHARSAALREATTIARDMGLQRTKNLTQNDLWALTDLADTSDIPANELRSFRRADLIMEATDPDGGTCYIAVEISFTANGRDTTRVLRNAEFLTRFTGKRSYAAVAGLYRDDRIQDYIDSGAVLWYQLDPEVLEAE